MKQADNKFPKITKGMPSAVLLSIVVHVALFLLAGMLVIFTVVKKEEKKFVPPKAVDRPKMKLRKPKVKVKKSSKPKPTTRIVTKVTEASMPDIQIPEMSGMGDGLAGGMGGFDLMPDLGDTTLFGAGQSIGNDFVGTFYDFKRNRSGHNIPMSPLAFSDVLRKFVRNGWKTSDFVRYYRSPKKLYATHFMIPPVFSVVALEAFGESDTRAYLWMVHYKGELVHQDAITFRFWGMGSLVLVVRVDGKVVLSSCWPDGGRWGVDSIGGSWQSNSSDSLKYFWEHGKAEVGDWITLEPGIPLKMEVIVGEPLGAGFNAMLAVEVEGVEYEKGPQGNPLLPMFKTAVPSRELVENIHADLVPGYICVTNGPVFCDYDTSTQAVAIQEPDQIEPPVSDAAAKDQLRRWTKVDGKVFDAEFVVVIGNKVVLKDAYGMQRKIPLAQLSEEDRVFIELTNPPKFNIDFSKTSDQRFFEESPYLPGYHPKQLDYVFSARLKQSSAGAYNHELKVEFFAIGTEIDGDNYILFDHQENTFTPSKENGRSHTFSGDIIPVRQKTQSTTTRGHKYGGYLVVVTDSRGKIIDHAASHKWLFGTLENLRQLSIGKSFDKTGLRVAPTRPTEVFY